MGTSIKDNQGSAVQVWHFIVHLRWHYQLFILSGGYLLGGLLSAKLDLYWFFIQFLNVHLLLFGGASAYNSYWDKDKGPIGGLRNPPEMRQWMWAGSLLLQMIGLFLALPMGSLFTGIYAFSILLFWLYSTPLARWKGKPIKSLFAIGISTGTNSVLLGFIAAGRNPLEWSIILPAIGVGFILLSLYPVSQSYQRREDLQRGDHTFAIEYGKEGVLRFFEVFFMAGLFLIVLTLINFHLWIGFIFCFIGLPLGISIRIYLKNMMNKEYDYESVMWIKYGTSFVFALFILAILVLEHQGYIIIS